MKKIIITILILAALALAGWLARPAYRAHKERQFAGQAQVALEKKEYRKALLNAQQALVLNSNNVVSCRVLAELADLSRSPHALIWRRRIAELEPTLENRVLFAACALRHEKPPFPLTTQTLIELEGAAQNLVAFHITSAQLALKQGRTAEAEKQFEEAIRLEPTNDLHRVNLAVVRLEGRDTNVAMQAHAALEQLQSNAMWGVAARRALVIHHAGRRQFAKAEGYSSALLRDPNSNFDDRLEHLAVLRGAQSPQIEAFLAGLQREAATNVFAAADLALRLSELGRVDDATAWVKSLPGSMRSEPPLPMTLANLLASAGRWREMEETLQPQSWKEQDFVRKALLSYAVRQQKETTVAAVHWQDAVQLASARPELLGTLAQMAAGWRWTNEAEAVLWMVAKQFPQEKWPLDSLQNGYVRMRNTRGLYEINALLLSRQPSNVVAQNNWATLSLLLQTNAARAHQLARQVYERDTNHFGFVSTYAFSLHLQGQTAEALKLIETLKPADLESPAVASYYGLLLAAAGQGGKARPYLDRAAALPILPEELQLVLEARKKL